MSSSPSPPSSPLGSQGESQDTMVDPMAETQVPDASQIDPEPATQMPDFEESQIDPNAATQMVENYEEQDTQVKIQPISAISAKLRVRFRRKTVPRKCNKTLIY